MPDRNDIINRVMVTSTYDVHNICNLRCEGCSYFVTDRAAKASTPSISDYNQFFADEVARGVTYPIFSGAEPSLNQEPLHVAARHWENGSVFTNGIKPIDPDLPFRVVVSVWSGQAGAARLRGANSYLKALRAAECDKRAMIFLTVTRESVEDIPEVVADCAQRGIRVTFNLYSMSSEYARRIRSGAGNDDAYFRFSSADSNLALGPADRERAATLIEEAMDRHEDTVLFTRPLVDFTFRAEQLHRIDPATGMALDCAVLNARNHASYNYDLTLDERKGCCSPDLDCGDCRVTGAAIATLLHRKGNEARRSPVAAREFRDLRRLMMRLYYWQ